MSKRYTVVAGTYELDPETGEAVKNFKYISALPTEEEALADWERVKTYPFAYVEVSGRLGITYIYPNRDK